MLNLFLGYKSHCEWLCRKNWCHLLLERTLRLTCHQKLKPWRYYSKSSLIALVKKGHSLHRERIGTCLMLTTLEILRSIIFSAAKQPCRMNPDRYEKVNFLFLATFMFYAVPICNLTPAHFPSRLWMKWAEYRGVYTFQKEKWGNRIFHLSL